MDREFKKVRKHYREHYFSEELADQIKARVHQSIKTKGINQPVKKRRYSIDRKVSYVIATFIILFGLLIGSALVSPTMAEVASKIPFLNKIFDQKPIHEVIREELEDRGYDVDGTGYNVQDKTYFVSVSGSEDYYNQVKADIKNMTEDVISSRGYNDFKVEVVKERIIQDDIDSTHDPKYRDSQLVMNVLTDVVPKLQEQGYKIHNYGVAYASPDSVDIKLDVDIEDTEKRTDEIEKLMLESIEKQDINRGVSVNFHPFNVKEREIEGKWTSEVLPVIWEGMLSKKEYKTKGVGYSYEKGTMNIFITTSINQSDDEGPELANKIEEAIDTFLHSDDLKGIVGDTPYNIIVRDKMDEVVN